jgi:hypothetical protein
VVVHTERERERASGPWAARNHLILRCVQCVCVYIQKVKEIREMYMGSEKLSILKCVCVMGFISEKHLCDHIHAYMHTYIRMQCMGSMSEKSFDLIHAYIHTHIYIYAEHGIYAREIL